MKAAVLRSVGPVGPGSLSLEELQDPDPGERQVLLRIRACGLCRTDLHILEGDLKARLPLVLGHQAVGVIEALGSGCKRLRPGDRVGVPWLWSACGSCLYCQQGLENLCDEARFTGFHVSGGLAERMVVPEAFAHRIFEGLPDAVAAPLLCAGAIGWRALRLAEIRSGRLGLFGFGSSAHLVLQLARARGLETYAFSRGKAHREHALRLGALWAGAPGEAPPRPLDAGIVFAPAGEVVPQALGALGKGGRLVLAGVTMSPIPAMPCDLLYQERVVRSVANVTRRDVEETLAAAVRGELSPEISTFSPEEAARALSLMKEGGLTGAAVVAF